MAGTSPVMTEYRRKNMPAYWVARSKINDPVEYKKYTDLVPGHHRQVRRQGAGARRQVPDHGRSRQIPAVSSSSNSRPWSRASPVSHRRNMTAPQRSGAAAPARSKPSWSRASEACFTRRQAGPTACPPCGSYWYGAIGRSRRLFLRCESPATAALRLSAGWTIARAHWHYLASIKNQILGREHYAA